MANDEIKKALNCCKNQCCSYCPHWCEIGCQYQTLSDALDLITEQEKEIEFQVQDRARLQRQIDELEQAHEQRVEEIELLKAENKQGNVSKILGNNVIVEFHDDIISEQPTVKVDSKDFEKYAKSIRNRIISIDETVKKQAQIDALNELKEKYGFYSCYSWNCDVKSLNEIVDKMIEELTNE